MLFKKTFKIDLPNGETAHYEAVNEKDYHITSERIGAPKVLHVEYTSRKGVTYKYWMLGRIQFVFVPAKDHA